LRTTQSAGQQWLIYIDSVKLTRRRR